MTHAATLPDLPETVDLRLVVTDMDGTLVDGEGRVPDRLPEVIERMERHGVMFVPASGRQLANIRTILAGTADSGPVIAENGTFVVIGDKEIYSGTLRPAEAVAAVSTVRELHRAGQDLGVVVATKRRAYVERRDERFVAKCALYYSELEVVPNVLDLALDDVIKVAVFTFGDAERECAAPLAAAVPTVDTVVSGAHWTDMMTRGVSKGRALAALQGRLGVTPAQTAVFGDYLNDAALYEHSELSFAMANAHPDILALARYTAPANTDDGVLRTVDALLDRLG